jgi:hypothetical protein
MKRLSLSLAALCALFLIVAFPGSAAGPGTVVCSQDTNSFTGAAYDLIVPRGGFCAVGNATILHDLIVQQGGGANIAATTIGYDLVAFQPTNVGTGATGPPPEGVVGPVTVGHDVTINGSPPHEDFVFDGLCSLTVGHDLTITNRSVTLGIGMGPCSEAPNTPNTIGHDLIVSNDSAQSGFFGPSSIVIANNNVGDDLIFTGNTAAPGGALVVSNNQVGDNAICARNNPPTSGGGNSAGGTNTCG